jgi:hypothetical protein
METQNYTLPLKPEKRMHNFRLETALWLFIYLTLYLYSMISEIEDHGNAYKSIRICVRHIQTNRGNIYMIIWNTYVLICQHALIAHSTRRFHPGSSCSVNSFKNWWHLKLGFSYLCYEKLIHVNRNVVTVTVKLLMLIWLGVSTMYYDNRQCDVSLVRVCINYSKSINVGMRKNLSL